MIEIILDALKVYFDMEDNVNYYDYGRVDKISTHVDFLYEMYEDDLKNLEISSTIDDYAQILVSDDIEITDSINNFQTYKVDAHLFMKPMPTNMFYFFVKGFQQSELLHYWDLENVLYQALRANDVNPKTLIGETKEFFCTVGGLHAMRRVCPSEFYGINIDIPELKRANYWMNANRVTDKLPTLIEDYY